MDKINIFLDDIRDTNMVGYMDNSIYEELDWTIVRNFDEFKSLIENVEFDKIAHISLDHDLADFIEVGGEKVERTGKTCAEFLVNYCMDNDLKLPEYHVHSSNPRGVDNIMSYLDNYKRVCE